MADHLVYAYLRQLAEAEMDEPVQRLREADLEEGDEESNRKFMIEYVCGICRRIRVSRATHRYLPELEDGVEAAVADVNSLLRVLDLHSNASPAKLHAFRRAYAGHWRRVGEEEERKLAIILLRKEVERGFTLVVAAAAETREEAEEDIWGTAAEEDEKVAAAAAYARVLEGESEIAVAGIAAHAFRA